MPIKIENSIPRYCRDGGNPLWWRIKYFIFDMIRYLIDDFYDSNQDFNCAICDRPVFKFRLTCSSKKCIEEAKNQELG